MNTSIGTNEPSTSAAPPPYKTGNSDVFVPKTCKDTHVGPQCIVKEAIYLEGVKRRDVMNNIDDCCISCEKEKKEKSIQGKLKKIKSNCTPKKCFLSGLMIVLIEIILLTFLNYNMNAKETKEAYFIDVNRIAIMHNNLERFKPRSDWIWERINNTHDCAYRCPLLKSKVRFIILPLYYHTCEFINADYYLGDGDFLGDIECYLNTWDEESRNQFRDIYYNYVISQSHVSTKEEYLRKFTKKSSFEGRSLTCPFDEPFLEEDHSSMITVGIDYCFPGRTERNSELSLGVIDRISDLITNLKEKNMLNRHYVLEFPDICNGSDLLEKVNRVSGIGHITFYKHELYKKLNVSTEIEPIMFSKLLFLPNDTALNDKISSSRVEMQLPSSRNISISNDNLFSQTVNKLTIKISLIYEKFILSHEELNSCISSKIFKQECLPKIIDFFKVKEVYSLDTSIDNYFIFVPFSFTHRFRPLNSSSNLNNNGIIVNIFLIDLSHFSVQIENEKALIWIFHEFHAIHKKLLKMITYSHVDFQVLHQWGTYDLSDLLFVYQHLTDSISYVEVLPSDTDE